MKTEAQESIHKLAEALANACKKTEEASFDHDENVRLFAAQFYEKGSKVAVYASPSRKMEDKARALHKMIRWHQSAGDLTTPMMISMEFDRDTLDKIMTLASVWTIAISGRSPAVSNWQRAIYG